ncbi:hypothetical protein QR680_016866 [Steinernema hermaphroditum]|uniref:Uncharacterized protein n=1 Tax=Steinernema hermaphroditum TaxID=289476 RepID=A0AA39HDH4_9BILA|nr:hypothetical protein QR680_016866 [Steinernema hermaphroditum]
MGPKKRKWNTFMEKIQPLLKGPRKTPPRTDDLVPLDGTRKSFEPPPKKEKPRQHEQQIHHQGRPRKRPPSNQCDPKPPSKGPSVRKKRTSANKGHLPCWIPRENDEHGHVDFYNLLVGDKIRKRWDGFIDFVGRKDGESSPSDLYAGKKYGRDPVSEDIKKRQERKKAAEEDDTIVVDDVIQLG